MAVQYGADVVLNNPSMPGFDFSAIDFFNAGCAPFVSDWVDISDDRIAYFSADQAVIGVGSFGLLLDSTTLVGGVMPFVYTPMFNAGAPAWQVTGETIYDVDISSDNWGTGWASPNSVVSARNIPGPGFGALNVNFNLGANPGCPQPVGVDSVEMTGSRVVMARELALGGSEISVRELDPLPFASFCLGDGTGNSCPCGNSGGLGEGCQNSVGVGGRMSATGSTSVSVANLVLHGVQPKPNLPGLYYQGDAALNGGLGNPFGDGLLCVGTNVIRLETVNADASGASSTSVNIVTEGGILAGQTRYYQLWYRDPGDVCGLNAGFNLTQGISVVWTP